MGGLCTKSSTVNNAPSGSMSDGNGHHGHLSNNNVSKQVCETRCLPSKGNSALSPSPLDQTIDKHVEESFPFPLNEIYDGIPYLPRTLSQTSRLTKSKQAVAKVSEVSSLLGKAGSAGLGKAVEVLDTLGSSMTNLNASSGFGPGITTKGTKIYILAFEVANTIVKGTKLWQSLSRENIKHLKEVVLPSEGVQHLISEDMDELLQIAAADKRDELKVFSGEVVRFGNRCKDPQWHNLDRYFKNLGSGITPQKQMKEEAETMMLQLMTLVQNTVGLYHEWNALDRFEQDYRRKIQEEDSINSAQRGDSLAILRAEIKSQRKHVKSLNKRSLWFKNLEEVTEKLVDIVHFLHSEIHEAFSSADYSAVKGSHNNYPKLGPAGLALHYATIITQIDTLVSRSSSVPPNTRDALYQGLPSSIKTALRSKLQSFHLEELSVTQIKAEMEKTLRWLVPVATNTTKAHHSFGWVGEWANTGSEVSWKPGGHTDLVRIETLHHAHKGKTEAYILELIVWLHRLVIRCKFGPNGGSSPVKAIIPSQDPKTIHLLTHKAYCSPSSLTAEDQEMLRDVCNRKPSLGISKSQEFDSAKIRGLSKRRSHRLSRSINCPPTSETEEGMCFSRRPSYIPVIDFDINRIKALDVIDRLDTIRSL